MANKDVTEYAETIAELSPVSYYRWATYVPGRSYHGNRDFMRHKRLGDAKNSLNMSQESRKRELKNQNCFIYNWDDRNNCWVIYQEVTFV